MLQRESLHRQRLITAFCIVVGIIFLLCVRVGYVQIVKKNEYTKKALLQQTKDEVIDARRGEIIDPRVKGIGA